MLGQFEHLAEAYFSGFRFDVGERQLDRILSVEHDLDSFIAAIGLSKYELETVVRDEGRLFSSLLDCPSDRPSDRLAAEITIEDEGLDIQSQMLGPMEIVLEATRSAKAAVRFVLFLGEIAWGLSSKKNAGKSPNVSMTCFANLQHYGRMSCRSWDR